MLPFRNEPLGYQPDLLFQVCPGRKHCYGLSSTGCLVLRQDVETVARSTRNTESINEVILDHCLWLLTRRNAFVYRGKLSDIKLAKLGNLHPMLRIRPIRVPDKEAEMSLDRTSG